MAARPLSIPYCDDRSSPPAELELAERRSDLMACLQQLSPILRQNSAVSPHRELEFCHASSRALAILHGQSPAM